MGWALVEVMTQDNTLLSVKNKATGVKETIDLVSKRWPSRRTPSSQVLVVPFVCPCRGDRSHHRRWLMIIILVFSFFPGDLVHGYVSKSANTKMRVCLP